MKKFLIIIAFICLGVAFRVIWPAMTLYWAKEQAIRKLRPEANSFNLIPSATSTNIPRRKVLSQMSSVELSGCRIALPDGEFNQDSFRKVVFTNENVIVVFGGAIDYVPLQRTLHCSNVFDLVSSAYHATVSGISGQRTMADLRRHVGLLNLKATILPRGADHLWLRFDRGDFTGFLSGDLAKDKMVVVAIYIKEMDQFFSAIIKKAKAAGNTSDMSAVFHILSILEVTPNHTNKTEFPMDASTRM